MNQKDKDPSQNKETVENEESNWDFGFLTKVANEAVDEARQAQEEAEKAKAQQAQEEAEKAKAQQAQEEAEKAKAKEETRKLEEQKIQDLEARKQELENYFTGVDSQKAELSAINTQIKTGETQLQLMLDEKLPEINLKYPEIKSKEDLISHPKFQEQPQIKKLNELYQSRATKQTEIETITNSEEAKTKEVELRSVTEEIVNLKTERARKEAEEITAEKNKKVNELAARINGDLGVAVDLYLSEETDDTDEEKDAIFKAAVLADTQNRLDNQKEQELQKSGLTEALAIAEQLEAEHKKSREVMTKLEQINDRHRKLYQKLIGKVLDSSDEALKAKVLDYYGRFDAPDASHNIEALLRSALTEQVKIGNRSINTYDIDLNSDGTSKLYFSIQEELQRKEYLPKSPNFRPPEMTAQMYLEFLSNYEQVLDKIESKIDTSVGDLVILDKVPAEELRQRIGIESGALNPETTETKALEITDSARTQLTKMMSQPNKISVGFASDLVKSGKLLKEDFDAEWQSKTEAELRKTEGEWKKELATAYDEKHGQEIEVYLQRKNDGDEAERILKNQTLEQIQERLKINPGTVNYPVLSTESGSVYLGDLDQENISITKDEIAEIEQSPNIKDIQTKILKLNEELQSLSRFSLPGSRSKLEAKKQEMENDLKTAVDKATTKLRSTKSYQVREAARLIVDELNGLPYNNRQYMMETIKQNPGMTLNNLVENLSTKLRKDLENNPDEPARERMRKIIDKRLLLMKQ